MQPTAPDTETAPQGERARLPSPCAVAGGAGRSVVLFGGMKGVPLPSMERYAEALLAELPGLGWPARLVRGRARALPGPRAVQFASLEFSRHVLYPLSARRHRGDVFHVTDHSFGHLVRALPAERTVVTCHDLMPWMVPEIYARRLGRTVGLPLWERSVKSIARAAHIVCDSTRTMMDVMERLGVQAGKVSVVPLAAGDGFVPFPPAQRRAARDRLGLPEDACLVIHTGSSAAYKNVESVIRAVSLLRDRGVPAWFLKVGPVTDEQRALITDRDLSYYFRQWTGVADDTLCALYNAADVMLFPSKYEGFGLPPLEAMKAGLPVVISRCEALVETTGGLVPALHIGDVEGMADAVQAIWEDRDRREARTSPGRCHADTYTWRRNAEAMAAVYERLMDGRHVL